MISKDRSFIRRLIEKSNQNSLPDSVKIGVLIFEQIKNLLSIGIDLGNFFAMYFF